MFFVFYDQHGLIHQWLSGFRTGSDWRHLVVQGCENAWCECADMAGGASQGRSRGVGWVKACQGHSVAGMWRLITDCGFRGPGGRWQA